MTDFKASYDYMKDLLNKENGEIIDGYDGSLIDNLFICTDSGFYVFIENYVTAWTSDYHVYFFRTTEENQATDFFYKCQAEYEALVN